MSAASRSEVERCGVGLGRRARNAANRVGLEFDRLVRKLHPVHNVRNGHGDALLILLNIIRPTLSHSEILQG